MYGHLLSYSYTNETVNSLNLYMVKYIHDQLHLWIVIRHQYMHDGGAMQSSLSIARAVRMLAKSNDSEFFFWCRTVYARDCYRCCESAGRDEEKFVFRRASSEPKHQPGQIGVIQRTGVSGGTFQLWVRHIFMTTLVKRSSAVFI